jgi:hypothetical protein
MLALLSLHLFMMGGGWGCGWLGFPLSFVLANMQAGAGKRRKPLQMTIKYLSYVLSSKLPGLFIPNSSFYPTPTIK